MDCHGSTFRYLARDWHITGRILCAGRCFISGCLVVCGIVMIPHFASAETGKSSDLPLGEAIGQVLAIEGDAEYGAYLATECVTCHQQESANHAIPVIEGLPRDYFVEAMLEYKYRVRENTLMQAVMGSLGLEELSALATYFSTKD